MKDWQVVFTSGTDYEAELVSSRLKDQGVDAVVLSQRDRAWNLNLGYLAKVRVFVPVDQLEWATEILHESVPEEQVLRSAAADSGEDPSGDEAAP